MSSISETFKAYVAGFIDGEGCIRISRRSNGGFDFCLSIYQVNPAPLQKIHEAYGGSLHLSRKQNPKHRDTWLIKFASKHSQILLTDILPYLIVKKDEAEIALKFLASTRDHNRGMSKFLSWEEMKEKQEAYDQLIAIKKRKYGEDAVIVESA